MSSLPRFTYASGIHRAEIAVFSLPSFLRRLSFLLNRRSIFGSLFFLFFFFLVDESANYRNHLSINYLYPWHKLDETLHTTDASTQTFRSYFLHPHFSPSILWICAVDEVYVHHLVVPLNYNPGRGPRFSHPPWQCAHLEKLSQFSLSLINFQIFLQI